MPHGDCSPLWFSLQTPHNCLFVLTCTFLSAALSSGTRTGVKGSMCIALTWGQKHGLILPISDVHSTHSTDGTPHPGRSIGEHTRELMTGTAHCCRQELSSALRVTFSLFYRGERWVLTAGLDADQRGLHGPVYQEVEELGVCGSAPRW